jgi:hypothetical protein
LAQEERTNYEKIYKSVSFDPFWTSRAENASTVAQTTHLGLFWALFYLLFAFFEIISFFLTFSVILEHNKASDEMVLFFGRKGGSPLKILTSCEL